MFNPSIPAEVAASGSEPSGYQFLIAYSDSTGTPTYHACTNNVSGCDIFATCGNEDSSSGTAATFTDQIHLTLSGNTISGTISRANLDMGQCTVTFDVVGTRK